MICVRCTAPYAQEMLKMFMCDAPNCSKYITYTHTGSTCIACFEKLCGDDELALPRYGRWPRLLHRAKERTVHIQKLQELFMNYHELHRQQKTNLSAWPVRWHCYRITVKFIKLGTITTKMNSIKQTKKAIFPHPTHTLDAVDWEEQVDVLWCTEIES
ncbi:hypothetical protein EMCRGX_G033306 [Ephydatia muelleri]